MKRISPPIVWAFAKLCAVLAAILSCSSKIAPDKPREIHWRGQESGYQGTTVVLPGDGADSGGRR
jgi:hypothetical protein